MSDARLGVVAEYPFQSREMAVGGFRMHYIDEGPQDGHPIVCVHGNPTWSFAFRRFASRLRDRYRVIAMDHIGCGMSEVPEDRVYPYRIARRIRDLSELLSRLELAGPITLVVHDWGGMIGTGWAVEHPALVRRMFVMNTAAFGLPEGKSVPMSLRLARVPGLGAFLVQGLNLFVRGACLWGAMKPLSPSARAGYLHPYDSWQRRLAVLRFVEDIPLSPNHPSWETLQTVTSRLDRLQGKPLRIAWGAQDFVFDEPFLDEWRQRFPQADIHRFAKAGHLIFEDEADAVVDLLESFLVEPVA